jgi:hypothetical protein
MNLEMDSHVEKFMEPQIFYLQVNKSIFLLLRKCTL